MGRDIAIGIGLVIATWSVYAGSLANDFISFDDPLYILDNTIVNDGLSWTNVKRAFSEFHSDNWHPLSWISHMIDSELFGLDPRGHHAVGVLLHSANALLLFAALLRLTGDRWPSAFTAALFALHPLRVESVAWASERKDLLSGLFFLLTLLAYSGYARSPNMRRYLMVLAAFAAGLLAKPMLVSLPVVLLLLDFWPLGRSDSLWPTRRLALEKLPFFFLALASTGITFLAQARGGTIQSLEKIPLFERLANASVSVFVYLGQMVWPSDLAFFYPHPALVETKLWLPLEIAGGIAALAGIGITALVWRARRSHPYLVVGWLWYLVMLIPVVGIVQVGIQAHADRYTYLPMIGIGIAVSWGLGSQLRRFSPWVAAVACLALATLASMSMMQVGVGRNSFHVYDHARKVTLNNYIALHNLGADHAAAGAFDLAERHYRLALAARPDYEASHNNLGVVLERQQRHDEALKHYREALRIRPDLPGAHVNLGSYYSDRGDTARALEHYRSAVTARPDDVLILTVLAGLEIEAGELDSAIATYQRALEVAPISAELHTRLADAARLKGDWRLAREQYEAALVQRPGLLPAANGLAWVLATSPDDSVRDGAEALRLAEFCAGETGRMNATFLETLAAAHAENGAFEKAIEWQDRAAKLTPIQRRQPALDRLAEYRSERPHREAAIPRTSILRLPPAPR